MYLDSNSCAAEQRCEMMMIAILVALIGRCSVSSVSQRVPSVLCSFLRHQDVDVAHNASVGVGILGCLQTQGCTLQEYMRRAEVI
jgi:hypothetical protein